MNGHVVAAIPTIFQWKSSAASSCVVIGGRRRNLRGLRGCVELPGPRYALIYSCNGLAAVGYEFFAQAVLLFAD